MGNVEIQAQSGIAGPDQVVVDVKFITLIADRGTIFPDTRECAATGNVLGIDDITGLPLIETDRPRQAIVEEPIVDPGIKASSLLPA